jgi:cyclic pyranopterin phosphate synthase
MSGAETKPIDDTLGRPLRNLRISVTDRCNLRCAYCMPEENYVWLPRANILSFEETAQLVDVFLDLGVERVRLTGGEPLLRHGLHELVRQIADKPRVRDLALTTNGLLLPEQAPDLRAAGLHRITVSLDTLKPDVFAALTRRPGLERVLEGIQIAARLWPREVKLDAVIMRGTNDVEIETLFEFARERGVELRYIEYMDVGGATQWTGEAVVSRTEILERIARRFGRVEPAGESGSAPAQRFTLADGTVFGIVASTTAPFCRACDRSRLTADGLWYLCLYAKLGIDLRGALRKGASSAELAALIARTWRARDDRGAEERLAAHARGPSVKPESLRVDPHLEMHTRGG